MQRPFASPNVAATSSASIRARPGNSLLGTNRKKPVVGALETVRFGVKCRSGRTGRERLRLALGGIGHAWALHWPSYA
jgi:hypothetical protein